MISNNNKNLARQVETATQSANFYVFLAVDRVTRESITVGFTVCRGFFGWTGGFLAVDFFFAGVFFRSSWSVTAAMAGGEVKMSPDSVLKRWSFVLRFFGGLASNSA